MKKLISILLMCMVLVLGSHAKAANTPGNDAEKIFLSIVIDTSPTSASTWRQMKLLARQAINSLHPGDRLEVLSARPGRPVLHLSALIESANVPGYNSLYRCLTDINQAFFLFKADVARAVETAFDDLNQHSENYRCCLIVLSDGKLDNNQIRQIRRLATAYRSRKWLFLFTAIQDANRRLFTAGSQNELQVALIRQVNLPQWLEKVRPIEVIVPAEEEIQRPAKSTDAPSKEAKEPLLPLDKTTGLPDIKGPNEPDVTRSDADTPQPGWFVPIYPITDGKQPPPPLGPEIDQKPEKPKVPDKPKAKAKSLFSILKNRWPLALVTGGILVGVILLLLILPLVKPAAGTSVLERESDTGAETRYMLMAESDGETYHLGEENNINNLIFGSDANSAIPLIGDAIEPEEFKLIRNRNGFKVQNLSKTPLNVNGLELKYRQKTELFFPATVHSGKKFRITFLLEQAEKPVLSATGGQENEIQ